VTNVAIIPISSKADATRAIAQARKEVSQGDPDLDSPSEEEVSDNVTDGPETEINSAPSSPVRETFHARGLSVGSIAEDVIGKRVRFGRFAANWLSRKNLGLPRPGALEQEVQESPFDDSPRMSVDAPEVNDEAAEAAEAAVPREAEVEAAAAAAQDDIGRPSSDQAAELLPKLIRYTKLLFASRNFFFAYDYDLTRSFEAQEVRNGHQPLHKAADPLVCFTSRFLWHYSRCIGHCFCLSIDVDSLTVFLEQISHEYIH
jgi:hypothetical protein